MKQKSSRGLTKKTENASAGNAQARAFKPDMRAPRVSLCFISPNRFLLTPSGEVRFLLALAHFQTNRFLFSQLKPWNFSVSLQKGPWTETFITF